MQTIVGVDSQFLDTATGYLGVRMSSNTDEF